MTVAEPRIVELQRAQIVRLEALVSQLASAMAANSDAFASYHRQVRRAASLNGRARRNDARKIIDELAALDFPTAPAIDLDAIRSPSLPAEQESAE